MTEPNYVVPHSIKKKSPFLVFPFYRPTFDLSLENMKKKNQ